MLETVEKLKANPPAPVKPAAKKASPRKARAASVSSTLTFVCRKCGHDLVGEEQFCGNCGTPRNADFAPPAGQTKSSPAWRLDEDSTNVTTPNRSAMAAGAHARSAGTLQEKAAASPVQDVLEFLTPVSVTREDEIEAAHRPELVATHETTPEIGPDTSESSHLINGEAIEEEGESSPETALVTTSSAVAWTSAANAREFLEQLAASDHPGALVRFWKARRADVYLAVAVIVVAVVIRWGIWSNHPVAATGTPATSVAPHGKAPAPDNELSFFDKMLISLGLADPPAAPEYKGNPDTQVWVDLHTALYYCPGTDLYGKTAKGKFATQRDAQLDQFEPAYRKACD